MEFQEKFFEFDSLQIAYYTNFEEHSNKPVLLYLHGLGGHKEWFPAQYQEYNLGKYHWIVVDLLGHGNSSKIEQKDLYTSDSQANLCFQLIKYLRIVNLILIGHSFGGPVALALAEKVQEANQKLPSNPVKIPAIFYLEGNIDIGDCTMSSKYAKLSLAEAQDFYQQCYEDIKNESPDLPDHDVILDWFKYNTAFLFWASSIDLMKLSTSNMILPRLLSLHDIILRFIYGEKNKGKFSSEQKIRDHNLSLHFIPNAGHVMHRDNPEALWKYVFQELSQLSLFMEKKG